MQSGKIEKERIFLKFLDKKVNYLSNKQGFLGVDNKFNIKEKAIIIPFGLVMHQEQNPSKHITIDSIKEFRELTEIKLKSKASGLLMVGGGVPKNFVQDTVVCAELLGKKVDMHKYAIQITVADTRDGACSSSTLKEASSWGKVDTSKEQMVFAEATSVLPLIASDAYHRQNWKNRERRNFQKLF